MKKLACLFLPVLLLSACGNNLETVTVQSGPEDLVSSPADTVFETDDDTDSDFIQVRVGEIAPIESLDPLYATSNSEYRVLSMIYEKLFDLNTFGEPAPELAKEWSVNEDSTQFTVHLKTNVVFHDSPVFSSGNGPRLTANMIEQVFKRMAAQDVPNTAARMFKNIHGFSAYRNEQMYVKNPNKRVLTSIEGIRTPNDSTLIFRLNKPSSDFMQKLAHPMASIYAPQSVPKASGPIQRPAGTGRFKFVKKEGNAYLFTPFDNYRGFTPPVSRLDIVSGMSERDLFQEFARGNLDVLMEAGANTLLTITDADGNLESDIYKNYELEKMSAHSTYKLYYNIESGQSSDVNEFLNTLQPDSVLGARKLGSVSFHKAPEDSDSVEPSRQLVVTHTEHPFELFLIDRLATQATGAGFSFAMNASYALSDAVTFSTEPYPNTQLLATWESPIYVLTNQRVSGIKIEHEPWNLNFISLKITQGQK